MDKLSGAAKVLVIPIFPLPNVVLFPGTLLPLHIFEPRYFKMISEALQGDKLVGVALLQPGWEAQAQQSPAVFRTGGMGTITEVEELEEEKFNILLSGRSRFRLIETVREVPYRIARVCLLEEESPNSHEASRLGRELIARFPELVDGEANEPEGLEVLPKLDFLSLVNSICASLQLSPYDRQRLLELDKLQTRAETVLRIILRRLEQKRLIADYRHLAPEDPSRN